MLEEEENGSENGRDNSSSGHKEEDKESDSEQKKKLARANAQPIVYNEVHPLDHVIECIITDKKVTPKKSSRITPKREKKEKKVK